MTEVKSFRATVGREPGDGFVQSLAKGLAVIRAFGRERPNMTLSEVAERTGLTRAGARRILLTLQSLGYVGADGRRFFLRASILDLGFSYLTSMQLWELAEPIMEELVERVHESCSLSVLEGHDIIYVLRVPTRRIMTIGLNIGSRLPACWTSMGRVLLGGLSEIELEAQLQQLPLHQATKRSVTDPERLKKIILADRNKGWSLVDQELEEGLRSIAVPIKNHQGVTVAALNIGGHAGRNSEAQMVDEFLPQLQLAAERINAALGMRVR